MPHRSSSFADELARLVLNSLVHRDLKTLERVCKSFKALLEDPQSDGALFHRSPGESAMIIEAAELHPLLKAVNCLFVTSEGGARLRSGPVDVDASAPADCDAMATSPACNVAVSHLFA